MGNAQKMARAQSGQKFLRAMAATKLENVPYSFFIIDSSLPSSSVTQEEATKTVVTSDVGTVSWFMPIKSVTPTQNKWRHTLIINSFGPAVGSLASQKPFTGMPSSLVCP